MQQTHKSEKQQQYYIYMCVCFGVCVHVYMYVYIEGSWISPSLPGPRNLLASQHTSCNVSGSV